MYRLTAFIQNLQLQLQLLDQTRYDRETIYKWTEKVHEVYGSLLD